MTVLRSIRDYFDLLEAVWKDGGCASMPYHMAGLSTALHNRFGIDINKGERLLVAGNSSGGDRLWEDSVAELRGIVPGVVLCYFTLECDRLPCTGLLVRSEYPRWSYEVEAFGSGEISLKGTTYFADGPGKVDFLDSAAVFHWGWGRDEGGKLGIPEHRWLFMREWIERWLG